MRQTKVTITMLDDSKWQISVKPEALKKAAGLPSGKVVLLERPNAGAIQHVYVKPYYRKYQNGDLLIFAVEVAV